MKIVKKILILIIITFVVFSIFSLKVYADDWSGESVYANLTNSINHFGDDIDPNGRPARIIVTIVRVVEIAVSFFCVWKLSMVGIRYFTKSAAYEKAQQKGELVRAVIFVACAFGASTLIEVAYRLFF